MKLSKIIALSSLLIFSATTVASCVNADQGQQQVEETIKSLKITNKTALTKEFRIGDEKRTIEVSIDPSTYTLDKGLADGKIKITTSDAKIVKVSGKTIEAIGKGTATIKVEAGEIIDSFQVTVIEKVVTPDPEPEKPVDKIITDITITNISDLTKKFEVGDPDKTIEVSLTPKTFNFDEELKKGTIKIESNNSRVVKVEGKSLKAVSVGTARITVKSELAYAEVDIEVSEKVVPIETISITNKKALTKEFRVGDLDRTIEATITPDKYNFDDCLAKGIVTVTSSNKDVISISGKTIKALKAGTSTITLEGMGVKDTVEITVLERLVGVPTITLDQTKLYVMTGSELVLPKATATSVNGKDLSDSVTISDSLESTITDGKFVSTVEGEHSLIYQAKDPFDDTKIAQIELKVEVCRKLFKDAGTPAFEANELTEKANQSYKVNDPGQGTKIFNMAPSKLYYAEATITMPEQGTSFWHGMAHYEKNSEKDGYRWMLDTIRNEGDITHLYLDAETWNTSGDKWMYNIDDTRDVPITQGDKTVKYAIARDGNTMYTFINDTFVTSTTDKYYFDKDTTPGFFTNGKDKPFEMTATAIDYFGGNDAKTKIQSLMGKDKTKLLTPYKNFELKQKDYLFQPFETAEKGLGYTLPTAGHSSNNEGGCNCYNSAKTMVKIETLFTGSWKVAWDWRLDSTVPCPHKQEAHHNVDVRRWHYGGEIARVGLEKQTPFEALKTWAGQGWGGEVNTDGFDFSAGYHFEIRRECLTDKDVYTRVVSSVKDPTQKVEGTFDYMDGDHGEPVYILFHNDGVTGELSHLTWENL